MLLDKKLFRKQKSGLTRYKVKCKNEIIQERNLFKSTLIHDMKTPVLALIQSAELLKKGYFGSLNELQTEITTQMQEAHYLLLDIIKNLNFLLTCENKEYCFSCEQIDLILEIKNCIKILKENFENKNQKVVLNFPQNCFLKTDKKIIQKIIYNLIINSVLLAKENSVLELNIKESNKKFYFYIKSKFLYMTKEKLKSMFSKESDSLCDFNQLGMGFNLNMAHRLINLLCWRLIASSNGGNIAVFGFVAPK